MTLFGAGMFEVPAAGGPAARTPGIGLEIVLQDLTTGAHTVVHLDPPVSNLAFFGAEVNQNLEFSPDGRKLLFSAGGDIYVADLTRVVAGMR